MDSGYTNLMTDKNMKQNEIQYGIQTYDLIKTRNKGRFLRFKIKGNFCF